MGCECSQRVDEKGSEVVNVERSASKNEPRITDHDRPTNDTKANGAATA